MVGSGEKQGKTTRCGITELPNCLTGSIVSLLHLQDAVNTILASPPQWNTLSHPILTRRNLGFNCLNVLGRNYRGTVHDVTARARAFVRRVTVMYDKSYLDFDLPVVCDRLTDLKVLQDRKRRKDKDDVDVNCVLDLVKAAPLLEEFTVTIRNGQDLSKTNPRETRNRSGFTNDHLRMVKMQGFTGNWYETELAICILEISPKLETLVIDQFGTIYLGDGMFSSSHWRHNYSKELWGVVEEKLKGVDSCSDLISIIA
ncbi:hypothetical protein ACLB2K_076260 [Fragaria x ananassa]